MNNVSPPGTSVLSAGKQCPKCGHRILTDARGELVPHMTGDIDRGGRPCGNYTVRDVADYRHTT